jgi:putative ABC transport system ATP-binding protein
MNLIEGRDITVSFDDGGTPISVLRGVSLDLVPGELVAVSGPSGSGKSVLLDVLAGWSRPDSGTVSWQGDTEPPGWARLGIVPQAMGLMPDLSVWHNVTLPQRLQGKPDRQAAEQLLDRLRLLHLADRSPEELSLGEQQRVSVARATLLLPAVVLADEPNAHQDAESSAAVLDALFAVCDAGGSVLIASHDEEVLRQADRILHLVDGQLA